MPAIVRKTSTKVVNGRVSPKSRSDITDICYTIVKLPAGRGYTHVVSPRQLEKFIEIIPDWTMLSKNLETIELASGYHDAFGYQAMYRRRKTGIIALCAWPKELWSPLWLSFFRQHRPIFDALGVEYQVGLTGAKCRFTIAQARAFSLLHVFMHELGHHRDTMRRRGPNLPNVEPVAEDFANRYFDTLLPIYWERFGHPAAGKTNQSALK